MRDQIVSLLLNILFILSIITVTIFLYNIFYNINSRLPMGVVTIPLRIIFRPAKTLYFTIKWLQLIVGSSFPVNLEQNILLPYPGVGVG